MPGPENPLLAASAPEGRYTYDPEAFFEAHARYCTHFLVDLWVNDQIDLPVPEDQKSNFRWALAMFKDALEYPAQAALADRMRELGAQAAFKLQPILRELDIDPALPYDYAEILKNGGGSTLVLAVRAALIQPGGTNNLLWYGQSGYPVDGVRKQPVSD